MVLISLTSMRNHDVLILLTFNNILIDFEILISMSHPLVSTSFEWFINEPKDVAYALLKLIMNEFTTLLNLINGEYTNSYQVIHFVCTSILSANKLLSQAITCRYIS